MMAQLGGSRWTGPSRAAAAPAPALLLNRVGSGLDCLVGAECQAVREAETRRLAVTVRHEETASWLDEAGSMKRDQAGRA